MKNVGKFAVGAGLSATASYVWTLIPNSDMFSLSENPLAFLEHYHWGLVSMNVAKHAKFAEHYKPYLNGFGVGMIAIEGLGSQPYGVGKVPWEVVGNITLGGLLVVALLL